MNNYLSNKNAILAFLILFAVLNGVCGIAQSESPYKLSWKVDGPVLSFAALSYGFGLVQLDSHGVPSAEDILNLDKSDVWSFERGIIGKFDKTANTASDILMYASFVPPILLASNKKMKGRFWPAFIVFSESVLLAQSATVWAKSWSRRWRPFAYDTGLDLEIRQVKTIRSSFFSGHSSRTSVLCFTTAKIFADHYPNSKAKPYVWAGAATISGAVGYFRTAAGKHFYTDVITGFSVGALCGILVPHFHKKKNQLNTISLLPSEDGVLLSWKF